MNSRLYLRVGEVPVLYAEDSRTSELSLWDTLRKGSDDAIGEYGKWRSRLAMPIMSGICSDHRLSAISDMEPAAAADETMIMPPKAWRLKPCYLTDGKPAVIVVEMKSGQQMREWKAPTTLPPRQMRRLKAIGVAYGVEKVILGVLIDGSTSQTFVVTVSEEEAAEMKNRVAAFIDTVRRNEEPDIDFTKDERAIRTGTGVAITITRTEHSTQKAEEIISERQDALAATAQADAAAGAAVARLRRADTMLLHLLGDKERLETDTSIIEVKRNAKGTPSITVTKKGVSLF